MSRTVVKDNMFPELVETYNTEGRTAMYDLLRSKYGMKQPYFVLQRLMKSKRYEYDPNEDRFMTIDNDISDGIFMNLDELCAGSIVEKSVKPNMSDLVARKTALEALVNELINDRLLILSRYITMDSVSRTILIDQTSLSQDGYKIISH